MSTLHCGILSWLWLVYYYSASWEEIGSCFCGASIDRIFDKIDFGKWNNCFWKKFWISHPNTCTNPEGAFYLGLTRLISTQVVFCNLNDPVRRKLCCFLLMSILSVVNKACVAGRARGETSLLACVLISRAPLFSFKDLNTGMKLVSLGQTELSVIERRHIIEISVVVVQLYCTVLRKIK